MLTSYDKGSEDFIWHTLYIGRRWINGFKSISKKDATRKSPLSDQIYLNNMWLHPA